MSRPSLNVSGLLIKVVEQKGPRYLPPLFLPYWDMLNRAFRVEIFLEVDQKLAHESRECNRCPIDAHMFNYIRQLASSPDRLGPRGATWPSVVGPGLWRWQNKDPKRGCSLLALFTKARQPAGC